MRFQAPISGKPGDKERAAQAIGAGYQGRRAGSLARVAAFSFYPSKNLGGFGDAGMVTTNDTPLGRQMARLRVHGMEPKYHHHEVGYNARIDALLEPAGDRVPVSWATRQRLEHEHLERAGHDRQVVVGTGH